MKVLTIIAVLFVASLSAKANPTCGAASQGRLTGQNGALTLQNQHTSKSSKVRI